LVYIFILVDVKHKEKDEEIKRIMEEIKRKDKEIKRKDEEIKRIMEEKKIKDEEIKRKDEEMKRKDEEIKRIIEEKNEIKKKHEIYKISKTTYPDFIGESFEIENGVLGLERDVYLSIVKFLDSSILRKV
jgi:ATP-dependent helicase YprA (DUF1998 family)